MTSAIVGNAWELAQRLLASQDPRRPGQLVAFIYARASSDPYGRGKSVERQVEDGWTDCVRNGWYVESIFIDNDRSASVYATKEREDYARMIVDMRRKDKHVDVLVCWEASRAVRDVRAYLDLADLSREMDVRWCFNGTIFNLDDPDDEFRTMLEAVLGHREVRKLAQRVRDGIAKAARDGKPHGGPAPYGYLRRYCERTRQFVAQEIDDIPRDLFDAAGSPITYTPAEVVREIFKRIAGGDSIWNTTKDLNRRGIPGPEGKPWISRRVRGICLNPAYAGWRVHRGELVRLGIWDPIIEETMFRAAKVRLEDPKRRTSRTNKAQHLLSYIARCVCGNPLGIAWRKPANANREGYYTYHCPERRCTSIRCEKLDAYVESVLIERMSDPDTLDWVVRPDDLAAQHAVEQADELRATIEKWKTKAKGGTVDPDEYEEIVSTLRARVAELDAAAMPTYIPMALRGLIGDRAAEVWDSFTLPEKRDILKCVITVELWQVGGGRRTFDPSRVRIGWPLDAAAGKGTSAQRAAA